MDKIQATTLVTTKRGWAHTMMGAPMVEVKVYKQGKVLCKVIIMQKRKP